MENPLKKLKKNKEEKPETEEKEKPEKVDSEQEYNDKTDRRSYSNERRKAFREKPIQDDSMSKTDIMLQHLMETELKVIQKKAKALYLDTEDNFAEKAEENYWKVSVNEFLSYVNQRSQIIIQQLSGESQAVEVELLGADEEGAEE